MPVPALLFAPPPPSLPETTAPPPLLRVVRARTEAERREARALRQRVMGVPPDVDSQEPHCDHLLVREETSGDALATARVLPQERTLSVGGFSAERLFDLSHLLRTRGRFVELSRIAVAPEVVPEAAMAVLWAGVAPYLLDLGYDLLIGRGALPLAAGMGPVRSSIRELLETRLAPPTQRVVPRMPLPNMLRAGEARCPLPAPLETYVRLGARVCGEAAWNPRTRSADLLFLLERRRLTDA